MSAMNLSPKIYAAVPAIVIGGGFYLWQLKPGAQVVESLPEVLPNIALSKADAGRITKIELTSPDANDKSQIRAIAIERENQDWELTFPLKTRASTSKVEALIDNLENLHLWEVIDRGTGLYDQYDLSDAKALHIVAWKGAEKAIDAYCGRTSTHGQFVRLAGKDGIFALVNWGQVGYQGFLYTRDLRSWRETSILRFDEAAAIQVEIANRNGLFLFSRKSDKWEGSFTKRGRNGNLGRPEGEWARFDESKVRDLLRAYRSLSADDFGDEGEKSDSGVDLAEKTGGIVRIRFGGKASDLTIRVGKLANRTTRWAIKDSRWAIREGGDGTLYALAPWTAAWATADVTKFEKATNVQ